MDPIIDFHQTERAFISLAVDQAKAYWARFVPLQEAACSLAGGWNHLETWLAIGRELLASGFAHDDPVDWLPNSSDLDRALRVLLAAALRGNRETIAQQIEAVTASNTVRRSVVESLVWSLPESILREWARRNREAEQAKVELAVQQSGLSASSWQQAIALAAEEGWLKEFEIQQDSLEAYIGSHIAPGEAPVCDGGNPPFGIAETSQPDQGDTARPEGPFDSDGFRFAGVEVWFGKAGKQYRLVTALWDQKANCPAAPRAVEDVINDVWGADNDTEDSTLRQLCSDTRRRFQAANCPLDIQLLNGTVCLIPK